MHSDLDRSSEMKSLILNVYMFARLAFDYDKGVDLACSYISVYLDMLFRFLKCVDLQQFK